MTTQTAKDLFEDDRRETAELLAGATMDVPDDKWPQALAELVDLLAVTFMRRGRDRETALHDAQAVVVAIGQHMGGQTFYLPRGDRLVEAVRDRRIWHEFNGRNTLELARANNLTERHLQRILAQQRAIHRRRIQPELFEESSNV